MVEMRHVVPSSLSDMAPTTTRSARTKTAILEATTWIVSNEGAAAVTAERVARQAGVGRATVYRHWPDGAELIQAALEQISIVPVADSDAPIRERIIIELERLANELKFSETRRLLSILLERAERLEAGESLRSQLVETIVGNIELALEQAVATGELTDAPDPEDMFDRLVGPLWARRMLRGRPITAEQIENAVDTALQPWLA